MPTRSAVPSLRPGRGTVVEHPLTAVLMIAKGGVGEHQGLDREGLLQGPRCRQGRQARGDQEGLPQAGAGQPSRTRTRAIRRPSSASRRSPRPTTCCRARTSARSTTRRGGCSAAAVSASRGPVARRVPAARRWTTCSATLGDGGLGDIFGGLFNGGGPDAGRPAVHHDPRPASGQRCRGRGHRRLRPGDRGRHGRHADGVRRRL